VAEFMAFEAEFTGGVNLAVGDVTGDGKADVVVGAGVGGAPRVRVFDVETGRALQDFYAYEEDFRGGAGVAVVDLDRDGKAEVVTGAGVGGGPLVRIFSGDTGRQIDAYYAAEPDARDGVRVGVSQTQSGVFLVTADTGVGGVKQYRPGNTQAGEFPLVPLPEADWIDVRL
jgi:hypothetical protein